MKSTALLERRATARVDVLFPVDVRAVGARSARPCGGVMRNISATGACFLTDAHLTEGSRVLVEFSLPSCGRTVAVNTRVRRVVAKGTPYRFAVGSEFEGIPPSEHHLLLDFVQGKCN